MNSVPRSGWTRTTLGACTNGKSEYGANASGLTFRSSLPRYVRITDISVDGRLLEENRKSLEIDVAKPYLLSDGDFLFARTGNTVGKTYLYRKKDGKASFAGYLIRFHLNPEKLHPDYLFQITHSQDYFRWVESNSRTGAQPNINAEEYSSLPLHLPPLIEQKKIADILSSVDHVMELAETEIKKLQMLKKGMMQELLTKGIRHNKYKDSAVGTIPEPWNEVLLDSVAKRGTGHTPNKEFVDYWNGGVKWISLSDSNALDRLYISSTQKNISNTGIENSSAVIHPAGVVVISRDAGVGKSAITTCEMAVSQHFITWECSNLLENHFLYYLLQLWKHRFEAIAMGSTIPTIGMAYFKSIRIPLPPINEQKAIASSLKSVDLLIFKHEEQLAQQINLKQALMQDLLTGKVRVKV